MTLYAASPSPGAAASAAPPDRARTGCEAQLTFMDSNPAPVSPLGNLAT